MSEVPKNSFSIILMVFSFCWYILIPQSFANSLETIKTETRETSNINNQNRNILAAAQVLPDRRNIRSIYGFSPNMLQFSRVKFPMELGLLVENDEGDRSKRFDDYGHMRFGKRGGDEQFDDYGHMRFGKR
ncbi:drosulfakinins [Teleopsis dalmanni]|uniref:drosulfakinins n=1 Tax=Teleopsis dalmanni TaxID=139649 RepID=UPI0018CD9F18|nr:drosulfakinins [Teleopsis dalmanni]